MPDPLTSHKPQPQPATSDLQEQIRRRAYEIYEQHNRTEGHEVDHWLQAEAERTGGNNQSPLRLEQWVAYDGWHCTQK